jgi:hypothetical protein
MCYTSNHPSVKRVPCQYVNLPPASSGSEQRYSTPLSPGGGELHASVALPQLKSLWYPLNKSSVPQNKSGRFGKAGNRTIPRTPNLKSRHYTDYTIPAPSSYGACLHVFWKRSCMQPTMDRPPACVSPGWLTTSHRAGLAYYETLYRASALLYGPTTRRWCLYYVSWSQHRKKRHKIPTVGTLWWSTYNNRACSKQ